MPQAPPVQSYVHHSGAAGSAAFAAKPEAVALFLPCAALVGLTALIWVLMYAYRLPAIQRGKLRMDFHERPEKQKAPIPQALIVTTRNLTNLTEMPIFFYAAMIWAAILGVGSASFVRQAWIYVGLRAAHSFVHVTVNNIPLRFTIYALSCLLLFGMWAQLVVAVL